MNTGFRRKEGEMWMVWGDKFRAVCIRESKLWSTTSSWKNLEVWTSSPWLRCQEQWLHKCVAETPQKPLTTQEAAVSGAHSQPGEGSTESLQWGWHRYWQQVGNALGMFFFPSEVAGKMVESSSLVQGLCSSKHDYHMLWLCSHKICDRRSWREDISPSPHLSFV